MHKKYHEKFKILDILAVTTQAREGIDTCHPITPGFPQGVSRNGHPVPVPGKKV